MSRLFILFALLADLSLTAQPATEPTRLSHYALDSFTTGTVLVKSGTSSQQLLNYNMLTGEMIFDNGGRLLAISNPADVDTVFIAGRRFVPVDNKFYEVLTNTPAPLMLELNAKIEEPPVPVGYGNSSATTNTTSYKSLVTSGAVYDIKLPDEFKVVPGRIFWIRKDGKYTRVSNARQLAAVFPEKKEAIQALVKKNHTNFSNGRDFASLIEQLEQ